MPAPVRKYKDLDLDMNVHPSTGDLVYLRDDMAVKRAVKNIVLTSYYERHFNDIFGCEVKSSLFENFSPMTMIAIKTSVEYALGIFEPRINVIEVEVDPDIDNNGYNLTIWFNILNQINPLRVDLFLEKVR